MPVHHATIHAHYRSPLAIVMKVSEDIIPVPFTPELRNEYIKLYNSQILRPKFKDLFQASLKQVIAGKFRYKTVSDKTGVPWHVIGIIHLLECNSSFKCHLHNGDPLSAKTVHVPSGRPPLDSWTWEDSAVDALQFDKLSIWTDWSPAGTLYRLELYNGFGSRNHGVPTPYLWSGTTFYTKGKYAVDGKWNPNLVSGQIGAAPILHKLLESP